MNVTMRRKQVLELVNQGFTVKGISSKLGITTKTVSNDKCFLKKQKEKEVKEILSIISDIKKMISKLGSII